MNTKNIPWIIALILAVGWLVQNLFFIKKCKEPVIHTIVVKGDSIPYLFKVYKPWPIYVQQKEIVEVPVIVDSAEVVKAYFSKVFYADTITNDTSMLAIIKDTITQNMIASREVWLQNLRPQTIVTQCPEIPKDKVRLLLGVGISGYKQFGVPFSLILETRQKMAFSVGYDAINGNYSVGYYYRIY
jgi:hypothetical protein